jgi:hypothetical protein
MATQFLFKLSFLLLHTLARASRLKLRHAIHDNGPNWQFNYSIPSGKPNLFSFSHKLDDDPLRNYSTSIEVARPIPIPLSECSTRMVLMNNHHFANDPPPFSAMYNPPVQCGKVSYSENVSSLENIRN